MTGMETTTPITATTVTTETRLRDRPTQATPSVAQPIDLEPLLGGWVNYDETATGIARARIDERDGDLIVRIFGAGAPDHIGPSGDVEPDWIDWGEAVGAAFSLGVDDHEATGFYARYDFGFVQVLLAAYLNKRLLVLDAYTTFADGSGRSAYFQRDHLYLP